MLIKSKAVSEQKDQVYLYILTVWPKTHRDIQLNAL